MIRYDIIYLLTAIGLTAGVGKFEILI